MGFFGLLAFTALLLLRPGELIAAAAPLRLTAVGSALAGVLTLFDLVRGRGPSYRAPQIYLVLLFAAWAAVSVILAQSWFGGAQLVLAALSTSLYVFFLVVLNVTTLRRLRIYAGWLALMGVTISAQGILAVHRGYRADLLILMPYDASGERLDARQLRSPGEYASEQSASDDGSVSDVPRLRHLGLLNDPNDLAQALVSFLPMLLIVRARRRRLVTDFALLSAAAVMLYAVYLTHSRGGMVALAVLIFVAASERLGRVLALALTTLGTAALLLVGFAAGRSVSGDDSTEGRIQAWTQGFEMLKDSPFWGIGFGSFGEQNGLVAHNSYVHCMAELGLVGYALWLGVIVVTLCELSALLARRRAAAEVDTPEAACVDDEPETAEPEAATAASSLRLSLLGFLAAAYFLSRAYAFLLFLLLALPVALADLSRRDADEPLVRLPRMFALTAGAVMLSVVVLNISVKIGLRLLMR